jgi:hypothetical protein
MIEVLTGGVSDRTENARGIAAEAKQLLQKLERQKRTGMDQARPRPEDVTPNEPATITGGPEKRSPALSGESQVRSAVTHPEPAKGPS